MPTARLCMRHTREILRHKWLLGSSNQVFLMEQLQGDALVTQLDLEDGEVGRRARGASAGRRRIA